MKIDIVSVFPDYFDILKLSLMGKAQAKGLLDITAHDLRSWTHDVHHSVDDTPVGGGAGMVMKAEVWAESLDQLIDSETASQDPLEPCTDQGHEPAQKSSKQTPIIIFPNPSAPHFKQADASQLAHASHLIFGCGRYEGYDARIPSYYRMQGYDVREYSIGDYVLNGGEVAVSVMLEAITRLIPGFMGNPNSITDESYTGSEPMLEYRQYTRPTSWRGLDVPAVLTSGDHAKVNRFRRDESIERTAQIRPDLIKQLHCANLDKQDKATLNKLGWDTSGSHPCK